MMAQRGIHMQEKCWTSEEYVDNWLNRLEATRNSLCLDDSKEELEHLENVARTIDRMERVIGDITK